MHAQSKHRVCGHTQFLFHQSVKARIMLCIHFGGLLLSKAWVSVGEASERATFIFRRHIEDQNMASPLEELDSLQRL